jgi:hypothetical protein
MKPAVVLIVPMLAFMALYTVVSRVLILVVRVVIRSRAPTAIRREVTADLPLVTQPALATVHSIHELPAPVGLDALDDGGLPRIQWAAVHHLDELDVDELPLVCWVAA